MPRTSAAAWIVVALALATQSCASLVGINDPAIRPPSDSSIEDGAASAEASGSDGEVAVDDSAAPDGPTGLDAGELSDATSDAALDAPQDGDSTLALDTGGEIDAGMEDASDGADSEQADPCLARAVDDLRGLYVSTTGSDDSTCGTARAHPCRTVGFGLRRALAAGQSFVYVAQGTYVESVTLMANVSVEGSWSADASGGWLPACGGDAGYATTIQAPPDASATIVVNSIGGAASIGWIRVASKVSPDIAPGESIYGVVARGSSTSLALANVSVVVASGGDGLEGQAGLSGASAGDGGCVVDAGGAAASHDGGDSSTGGQFTSSGYVAGDGVPGADGVGGSVGTASAVGGCSNACGTCDTSCTLVLDGGATCGGPGQAGCGGGGGGGGGGGRGGGSSVAVLRVGCRCDL